jgi:hypothetical protein
MVHEVSRMRHKSNSNKLIKILKSREDKVCPLLENYFKTDLVDEECIDQFNSTLASKIGQLLKIVSREFGY